MTEMSKEASKIESLLRLSSLKGGISMNDWIWGKHFTTRSECANYWNDKSIHLRKSSKILWKAWENGNEELFDSGATYRMLMGMSFELMFKAFVVAMEKDVVATHDLNILAEKASFKLDDKEKEVFTILSGYIYWEGRYPVPKPMDTRKKKISGAEGIKLQWEPFISYGQTSKLSRSDLDYDNLLLLWTKFNKHYVNQYIET